MKSIEKEQNRKREGEKMMKERGAKQKEGGERTSKQEKLKSKEKRKKKVGKKELEQEEEGKSEGAKKKKRRFNRCGEDRGGERLKHFTPLIPIYGAIKRVIS